MPGILAQFEAKKYLSIETYRKTGEPVRTPVWFVENRGALYVRTSEDTGKYKRIRNSPAVKIAPCDSRGKVEGEWVQAEAKPAGAEEAEEAYRLFRKKYGVMYMMTKVFLRSRKYVVLKITERQT